MEENGLTNPHFRPKLKQCRFDQLPEQIRKQYQLKQHRLFDCEQNEDLVHLTFRPHGFEYWEKCDDGVWRLLASGGPTTDRSHE